MANFNIKKYSTDVVLSTNTFPHINSSHRKKAFKKLIKIIKKNGYLIVDSDINDLLDFKLKKVKQNFREIELIYFRNYFNFAIENFYLKNNFFYFSFKYSGIIYFLTFLEYFTSKVKVFNKSVLIVAKKKIK